MDVQASQPRSLRASNRMQYKLTRGHSPYPDESISPQPRLQGKTINGPAARISTDVPRMSKGSSALANDQPDISPRSLSSAGSSLVNPTSSLLQGLISKQRAARESRRTASHHVSNSQPSTPTNRPSRGGSSSSEKQRRINSALSAGLKQPREMGVREMDQYVSKINKLNFDLKLEIFYRVQQAAAMEKKLERMQELEEQLERMGGLEAELEELRGVEKANQRLRESNEQLRLEIDKRDQAVNEAVELICQLEAKLEAFELSQDGKPPSAARPHTSSGMTTSAKTADQEATPKSKLILDVPDRTSSRKATSPVLSLPGRSETPYSSRRPRRNPSFLRENSESTSALRSLYVTDENKSRGTFSMISRPGSLLSGDELPEPGSPRLSILSECSYFNPPEPPTGQLDFDEPSVGSLTRPASNSDDKLSRIDNWIKPHTEFCHPEGPKPLGRLHSPRKVPNDQPSLGPAFQANRPAKPYKLDSQGIDRPVFTGGRLPPTPDTMSTSNPDMKNGSSPSIIAEKSQCDQGQFYSFSMTRILSRPLSAGDFASRPSSAVSDSISDVTQQGLNLGGTGHLTSMFPYFSYTDHGSSKISGNRYSEDPAKPRFTKYAGGLIHQDDRMDEAISSTRDAYPPSLVSTAPEPRSSQPRPSSSPPLTSEDWLEAASAGRTGHYPTKDIMHSDRSSKLTLPVKPINSKLPPGLDEQLGNPAPKLRRPGDRKPESEEPRLPPVSDLRPRIAASNPEADLDAQPRRRLSLRPPFFTRSVQPQVPMSDPLEKAGAQAPTIRRTRRLSVTRQRNMSTGGSGVASLPRSNIQDPGDECILQSGTIKVSRPPTNPRGNTSRPRTSDGSDYKRRGSFGIFGWMKGPSGSSK